MAFFFFNFWKRYDSYFFVPQQLAPEHQPDQQQVFQYSLPIGTPTSFQRWGSGRTLSYGCPASPAPSTNSTSSMYYILHIDHLSAPAVPFFCALPSLKLATTMTKTGNNAVHIRSSLSQTSPRSCFRDRGLIFIGHSALQLPSPFISSLSSRKRRLKSTKLDNNRVEIGNNKNRPQSADFDIKADHRIVPLGRNSAK